jgi:hypothetical protein
VVDVPLRLSGNSGRRTGESVFNDCFRTNLSPLVNGHPALPRLVTSLASHPVEIVVERISADDSVLDIVQEWGEQSFPASDPPSNW